MSDAEKKFSIFPIWLLVFIDLIGIGIVIPILAPIFLNPQYGLFPLDFSFRLRTILLGLLIGSFPIAQFFGAPVLGALSDRHGRKKMAIVSLTGTFIGYVLFAIALTLHNIHLLFFSRVLAGFFGGSLSIAFSAIADISDEKSKAKNFGLLGMAFGLGFIIGPFIGGKLADPNMLPWFDFATPLWFAALLTLFNIATVVWGFNETLKTMVHSEISFFTGFKNLKKAFQMQNLRVVFTVVFLLSFGFSFFAQFYQVFLIEKFHFNQSQIGTQFAYIGLWIAFAQGVITRIFSKKFNPKQILTFSTLLLSITFPLLLWPSNSVYLYFIMPFIAIFQGLTFPNYTALVSGLSAKDSQGEILGINQSIQSIGMAIPPIIAGFIVSLHLYLPILVAGILTFIAWIVFVAFFRPKENELFHEV